MGSYFLRGSPLSSTTTSLTSSIMMPSSFALEPSSGLIIGGFSEGGSDYFILSFIWAAFIISLRRRFLGSFLSSYSLRRCYVSCTIAIALFKSSGSLRAWLRGLSFSSVLSILIRCDIELSSSSNDVTVSPSDLKEWRNGSLLSGVPFEIMTTAFLLTLSISLTSFSSIPLLSGPHYILHHLNSLLQLMHRKSPYRDICRMSYLESPFS